MVRAICNNNPFSKEVIEYINEILLKDIYKKPVVEKLLSYFPREIREKYRRINMEGIGKNLF